MGRDLPPADTLLTEQRRRWAAGDRVRVAHFLDSQPLLRDHPEVLLDLIYGEFLLRREAGERPAVGDYLADFPDLAEALRVQFEVDAALDEQFPPTLFRVDTSESPATNGPAPGGPVSAALCPPGYEISEELGRGGMGVVYKARQKALDRLVALKMIRSGEMADPDERHRFEAEARAVARLSHPNIVQIYEVGEVDDRPYIALEYVPGGSLADALHGQPFPPRSAAALAATLARAIQHAHEQGIVHRDLKPANVLLQSPQSSVLSPQSDGNRLGTEDWGQGTLKLTDFGLAKHLGADGLTRTGDFLGTPNFAAPEQAAGLPDVGPAADVYSLGAILYNLVTGRPPFTGATPLETLDQVRFADPVSPSRLRPNLPRDVGTIILTCLRKEPARRYASAAALADDLDRFLAGQSIRARPVGSVERAAKWARRHPAVTGLVAALVLVFAAGVVATAWKYEDVLTARDRAVRAEAETRLELHRREVANYALQLGLAQRSLRDGRLLAVREVLDQTRSDLRGWEYAHLNEVCDTTLRDLGDDGTPIRTIAFGGGGRFLVTGSGRPMAFVRDVKTGRVIRTLTAPGQLPVLTADPVERHILGGCIDGRVCTWDLETGKVLGFRQAHTQAVSAIAFSGDGSRFVTSSRDPRDSRKPGEVKVWDRAGAKERLSLTGHTQGVFAATISPDGIAVVTASGDGTVRVWDADAGRELRRLPAPSAVILALAFAPDGKTLAAGCGGGWLMVWDWPSGEVRMSILAHDYRTTLAYSPDGGRLATAGGNRVRVWDVRTGDELLRLSEQEVGVVAFAPDGRHVVTGSVIHPIREWNVTRDPAAVVLRENEGVIHSLAFGPGRWIVTGSVYSLQVHDVDSGKRVAIQTNVKARVLAVASDPLGRWVAGAWADRTIRLFDPRANQDVRVLAGLPADATSLVVRPDGRELVAGYADGTIRVYDTDTGRELRSLIGHEGEIQQLACAPDGRVASASDDGTARVWDPETGQTKVTVGSHVGGVKGVAFADDGQLFATVGADLTARVWDARTGEQKMSVPGRRHVALLDGGRRLVTMAGATEVRLYDVAMALPVYTLEGPAGQVQALAASPDGRRIASGGLDRVVRVWSAGAATRANEP
jgi:WD40 repeat protein